MSVLNTLISYADMFQRLNPLDCCVMISDKDGVIVNFVQPKGFTMNVSLGAKVSSSGSIGECLTTRKEVKKTLPKELYGIPIKAISVPIFEDNQLIGVLATATSLETQEALQNAAQTIAATTEEITATTEEVASSASILASNLTNLKEVGELVLNEIQKTDNILKFVSDVSANSNLLGLNAAIEAARAGEHGRGFAVVAVEIRKMADSSSQSVKDIKEILQSIQTAAAKTVTIVGETTILGEKQAAATEEISASMEQLASSALHIEKIAEIV